MVEKILRNRNPDADVLPLGAVLLFDWDLGKLRKREKAYPYGMFMVGANEKVQGERYPHYMGYWLWQEKEYFINGK